MLMGIKPEKHGSFEDFAIQICREMTIRGHIPHLAFPTPLPGWYKEHIQNAGGRLASHHLIARPFAPGSLWQYLNANNIDILHLHLVNSLVAWLWKQRTGLPLVLTLHVARDYGGNRFLNIAAAFRARLIYRSARLIAISDFMRNYALRLNFGINQEQVIRIYNGVDTNRFSPANHRHGIRRKIGWQSDAFVFVTVSHLIKNKNVDALLKAFALVTTARPLTRLAVVGYGPELKALKELAQTLKIYDKTYWMGRRDDVDKILPAADVFILTPTCEEAFGYVFAEAQSCGLPVITSRSGATLEIICDEKTGIILTKNDVYGLAEAMVEITENMAKMQEMAHHARMNALEYFNIRNQVKAIVNLYEAELRGMNRS